MFNLQKQTFYHTENKVPFTYKKEIIKPTCQIAKPHIRNNLKQRFEKKSKIGNLKKRHI